MPSENFNRIDLDCIYLPFLEAVLNVISRCNDQGVNYVATSGFRSPAEQMKLWSKGRTAPGAKVTNARGGYSQHNFGLAIDFTCMIKGQPSWVPDDYKLLALEVKKEPLLHSGSEYKDWPHVGWHDYKNGVDLHVFRKAWNASTVPDNVGRLNETWKKVFNPEK